MTPTMMAQEITGKLFKILKKLDVDKFDEIAPGMVKGTLSDRIKSIALHVMGHTGQIVLIRKMLDNPSLSFIRGALKEERKKLRKEWMTWWEENKNLYQ